MGVWWGWEWWLRLVVGWWWGWDWWWGGGSDRGGGRVDGGAGGTELRGCG